MIKEKFQASWGRHPNRLEGENYATVSELKRIGNNQMGAYLIPRDRNITVVNERKEIIAPSLLHGICIDGSAGYTRVTIPFSSFDFCIDLNGNGFFEDITNTAPYYRQFSLNQLAYLIPILADEEKNVPRYYMPHLFTHTRGDHTSMVLAITFAILCNSRLPLEDYLTLLITAAYHDAAMPAGGESTKRLNRAELDEEKNFEWILDYYNLAEKWKKKYGFNREKAALWVRNLELPGKLLDITDKIAYVGLDAYHIGRDQKGKVRNICLRHPLIIDIWQDVKFTEDRSDFAFVDPERLFLFLLLRAYEYMEVFFNPQSRLIDLYIESLAGPLYEKGIIVKEELLTKDDAWIDETICRHYQDENRISLGGFRPQDYRWKKFDNQQERARFCEKMGDNVIYTDAIKGFSTGLDWEVWDGKKIVKLRHLLSKDQIAEIEEVKKYIGYYAYLKK